MKSLGSLSMGLRAVPLTTQAAAPASSIPYHLQGPHPCALGPTDVLVLQGRRFGSRDPGAAASEEVVQPACRVPHDPPGRSSRSHEQGSSCPAGRSGETPVLSLVFTMPVAKWGLGVAGDVHVLSDGGQIQIVCTPTPNC